MKLVGGSSVFKNVKQQLNKVSQTNSRVLISGPSGSGKELIARWIHKKSNRNSFPFIIASCATLSPERVEQVLFGWSEKLNDDQSSQYSVGLFEQANNGTLFLMKFVICQSKHKESWFKQYRIKVFINLVQIKKLMLM